MLQAIEIAGKFSEPSKIPTYCYSLPASECNVGSKLAKIEGSVCSKCYALKGWFLTPWVINYMYRRLESLVNRQWVDAIVYMIKHYNCAFFRWHDSGDLQGLWHLQKIFEVCYRTSDVRHWLPTKEMELVKEFRDLGIPKPTNLNIQVSAFMIEQKPPIQFADTYHVSASGVSTYDYNCPASEKTVMVVNGRHEERKGYCGSCRKCWDENNSIVFKFH